MNTGKLSSYELQAIAFCEKTNVTVTAEYVRTGKHFDDDKEDRDIYKISISRHGRVKMSFDFGQAIAKKGGWVYPDVYDNGKGQPTASKVCAYHGLFKFPSREAAGRYGGSIFGAKEIKRVAPTAYDVLACITKYHPGTLEDFCSEFGYDTDSKKAEKTYYAVLKEYADVSSIFSHQELEELAEIS